MASEEEKMQGILETVDQQEMVGICGRNDEFLRLIRGAFDCTIVARGNQISMSGRAEEVALLEQLLQELLFLYRQGLPLTTHDVRYSMYMVKAGKLESLHRMYADTIIVNNARCPPRSHSHYPPFSFPTPRSPTATCATPPSRRRT